MERYSLDLPRAIKNREYTLEVGVWGCTWTVNAWNRFFVFDVNQGNEEAR